MRALIIDKDPYRRRVSRAALRLFDPMLEIVETECVSAAKRYYSTFQSNFLVVDMNLSGAVAHVEYTIMNNWSAIPQIFSFEGPNKLGVSRELMLNRFDIWKERGYLGNIPVVRAPENDGELPRQLCEDEAQKTGSLMSFNLIVPVEWPLDAQEFLEVIKAGYKWRGHYVQNTPLN